MTPALPERGPDAGTMDQVIVSRRRESVVLKEMKEDPSEPSCRRRLQTAISCFGQKPRW